MTNQRPSARKMVLTNLTYCVRRVAGALLIATWLVISGVSAHESELIHQDHGESVEELAESTGWTTPIMRVFNGHSGHLTEAGVIIITFLGFLTHDRLVRHRTQRRSHGE